MEMTADTEKIMFQFPSNGKHFQNEELIDTIVTDDKVSIPFKREALSEQKTKLKTDSIFGLVSIPFKREALSEL